MEIISKNINISKYLCLVQLACIFLFGLAILSSCSTIKKVEQVKDKRAQSVCNPLDLNYRFQIEEPSRREAADPTVVWFRDRYFLFASMSGGYWHSKDLVHWAFIETNEIPTEEYAPTAISINDTLYFLASSATKSTIYKSSDPLGGKWAVAKEKLEAAVWDPAFLLDDDNRLYLYWGIMNNLRGVELDYKNNFSFIGKPVVLLKSNPTNYGWEVPGDYNDLTNKFTFIEGSWVNKNNGKYYYQYAAPGTEFKSYADGAYISENPLGPYMLQVHNPFSYKPEGFINGAGHGSTFKDKYGNFWHISTMSISIKHNFERRLGMWPAFFDKDGILYTYTGFGDFPHKIPAKKISGPEDFQPTGMILSYNKPVEVSSEIVGHPKEMAVNENVREYWSAETGNKGEWIMVDLENKCEINSVQVNYADEGTTILGIPRESLFNQYLLEYSNDKQNWKTLADMTTNQSDNPHSFVELSTPVTARYIKLTNYNVQDGNFAISGLRVFGFGNGDKPKPINLFSVLRSQEDARKVTLKWTKQADATGYNVRYGIQPDKLYLNYCVFGSDSVTINSLNSNLDYYITIDAFNQNGITKGDLVKSTRLK